MGSGPQGLLTGAGALLWADLTQREGGYLTSGTATYAASGHALASDTVHLHGGWDWFGIVVGQVRIRATATNPAKPVFVAVGPAAAVAKYLAGVRYTSVTAFGSHRGATTGHPGTAAPPPPATAGIWTVQAAGTGTQTLLWTVRSGDWIAVAMNPDGSAGITVRADVGAAVPGLPWIAAELLTGSVLFGLAGFLFFAVPMRRTAS